MMIYRCLQSVAFARPDGADSLIGVGEVLADTDPRLVGRSDLLKDADLFEPMEAYLTRRTGVEQATADPGEKRSVQPATATRRGPRSKTDKEAS